MVRHPLVPVRDVVHRVTDPARTRRGGRSRPPVPEDGPAAVARQGADDREEELAAMRAAEAYLGDDVDDADRATRTANAYLAARRRRLRRQLGHAGR